MDEQELCLYNIKYYWLEPDQYITGREKNALLIKHNYQIQFQVSVYWRYFRQ